MVDASGRRYVIEDSIPRLVDEAVPQGRDATWNRVYELCAPFYEINQRLFGWVLTGLDMLREQERMIASLGLTKGSSLLEICTGPGLFQPMLAAAVGPQGRLAALDLSMNMLRRCLQRTRAQTPMPLVVQGNGARLPFADCTFEYVFHFGGIKLFSSREASLKECARVLKPGGRLFVGDEGYAPTIPVGGWRRRLLIASNPGFQQPPPAIPAELRLCDEKDVYDGLAFLWTLERVEG